MNAAETLAKTIVENYDNPLQDSTIDVSAHVESLLRSLGATTSDSGGKVTYYGSDPITPDPDPDGFVVDTPMGRYTGVTEMVEMSKTPGEYKHPLTPLGSWQPSWL